MKYLVNKKLHLLAVKFPPKGRTLKNSKRSFYLKFPEHLFVFPITIENGRFVADEMFGVQLLLRKGLSYYVPPLTRLYGSDGRLCISSQHEKVKGSVERVVKAIIEKHWATSYGNKTTIGSPLKTFNSWLEESKQNRCSCYQFRRIKMPKFETITLEDLRIYLGEIQSK